MRRARLASIVAAIVWAGTLLPAVSAPGTDCAFGGPTPGFEVLRLDLPTGTDFLTLELGGNRVTRGVNDDQNWHLAQGIVVLNADTLAVEAYRVKSQGMAPRQAVVAPEGADPVRAAVVAPDVPYEHHAARLRDNLPPGSYYVVVFGVDGGSKLQNEWWSAGVQVSGSHPCQRVGIGETFDYDHTDFTGGTQVYAPGAGYADGIGLDFSTARPLVVGLIDAETQARAGSSIALDYTLPTASGTVSQDLIPFVSRAGAYHFEGSYHGYYPAFVIAGAAVQI